MMKRKNIIILLFVCFIGVILTPSFKNFFLEKPKGGSVTADTIFNTKNQAQFAVAQMYLLCIKGYFPTAYNMCRPEAITDQLYILHPAYDWAANVIGTGSYITGNMSANNTCDYGTDNNNGYGTHYQGIRQANLVLKYINKVNDADNAWKTDVKGQALFCRAMQHFDLFRYYGGIPIVNKALDGGGNTAVPRSSVQSVVDSVVKWCDLAATMLPATRASAEFGRATKLSALALKSRILLYAASPLYNTPPNLKSEVAEARFNNDRDTVLAYPTYDRERWNKAAKAAKDVIDNAGSAGVALYDNDKPTTADKGESYATIGDYESVWNVLANKEIILANTASGDSYWARYLMSKIRMAAWGVKNNVPIEFMQQYEKRDGTKWTLPANGKDLPTDIKALDLDPRFYQSIAYDGMYYNTARGILSYYKKGDYANDGAFASSDAGLDGYALVV
jgi:hypothetical protein